MPSPPALGIHVIGSGFGESVLVELPDGSLGIVDCCCATLDVPPADRHAVNPTIGFIRKYFVGRTIRFLALTHPHEDHGRGFNQLLDEFGDQIEHIWCCNGLNEAGTRKYFECLAKCKERLEGEKLFDEDPGSFAFELYSFAGRVAKNLRDNRCQFLHFNVGQRIQLCGGEVTVTFLGPRQNRTFLYSEGVSNAVRNALDATGQIDPAWRPPNPPHNEVSPAIHIQWRKAVAVLGGDMERDAWGEAITDAAAAGMSLSCGVVKVSHHGSSNGYCPDLYDRFGDRFVAIITPFSRNRRPLPEISALRHVLEKSRSVLITNWTLAIEQLIKRKELSALSPALFAWVRSNPDVLPYLSDELVTGQIEAAPLTSIPANVVRKIASKPEIVTALKAPLRKKISKPPDFYRAFDQCRASVYLNANGHELKRERYLGKKAGEVSADLLQ